MTLSKLKTFGSTTLGSTTLLPLISALAGMALTLLWAVCEGLFWLYRQINWTKVFHWTGLACWLLYMGTIRLYRMSKRAYDQQTTVSFALPWPPVTKRHPALGMA